MVYPLCLPMKQSLWQSSEPWIIQKLQSGTLFWSYTNVSDVEVCWKKTELMAAAVEKCTQYVTRLLEAGVQHVIVKMGAT